MLGMVWFGMVSFDLVGVGFVLFVLFWFGLLGVGSVEFRFGFGLVWLGLV